MRTLAIVHRLVVQTNDCGEVFVYNQADSESCVRIGPDGRAGLVITASNAQITPGAKNGLPAFTIHGK